MREREIREFFEEPRGRYLDRIIEIRRQVLEGLNLEKEALAFGRLIEKNKRRNR